MNNDARHALYALSQMSVEEIAKAITVLTTAFEQVIRDLGALSALSDGYYRDKAAANTQTYLDTRRTSRRQREARP